MQRVIMAAVAVVAGIWLFAPGPEAAGQQGQGRGGGKGGGQSPCVDDEFTAQLEFTGSITSSDAADPWITARFRAGNISGEVENANALPVTLHFPDQHRSGQFPPPVWDGAVDVDPWVATGAYEDTEEVTSLECGMLGMVVGAPYRMRLALRWYENLNTGEPMPLGDTTEEQSQWFLRWRPNLLPDEHLTYLDAVRADANTWWLSTRADSIPEHFGSLERSPTGKGKNKIARIDTTPIMPFDLTIEVDCGGDCATPESPLHR